MTVPKIVLLNVPHDARNQAFIEADLSNAYRERYLAEARKGEHKKFGKAATLQVTLSTSFPGYKFVTWFTRNAVYVEVQLKEERK